MDRIRTLLLARTSTVVLDPDSVASAATRPSRDVDIDKLEEDLVQLGYVLSLDLAITIRRLPHQAIQELREWLVATLSAHTGVARPVSRVRAASPTFGVDPPSAYAARIVTWLRARPKQPCPWCGEHKAIGALDPCGHLVCRRCWDSVNYGGCPICHRRVTAAEPFLALPATPGDQRTGQTQLTLLHLAIDVAVVAQARFAKLLSRHAPASSDERAEIEAVVDTMGDKAIAWLPARIPNAARRAHALARIWWVSADRSAAALATSSHVRGATDVLRVAVALMQGDPALAAPNRLRSIGRGLRRAVLEALERLPPERVAEHVRRHRGLWKRVGERLHPFEFAERLPNAALAFAVVRSTDVSTASFGPALIERAQTVPTVRVVGGRMQPAAWAAEVEGGLARGDVVAAVEHLRERPAQLLRRADHVLRVAERTAPHAIAHALVAIGRATRDGDAMTLLGLASHIARRGSAWPRRVFFARGDVLHAWRIADARAPLRADAIAAIVTAARGELVARARKHKLFARAVLDRALGDLPLATGDPPAIAALACWPRGSEVALPAGDALRITADRDALSIVAFDADWRFVTTVATDAALSIETLYATGARQLVVAVAGRSGYVELATDAATQRFDIAGRALVTCALAIDLAERRTCWLGVPIADRAALAGAGGFRAALAHAAADIATNSASQARPTLWDLACVHAAARANVVYIRERDGAITTYRRRDHEDPVLRLGRVLSGANDDGTAAAIPVADAPTLVAVLADDLAIPRGSAGYILDARRTGAAGVTRMSATELVATLNP